METLGRKKQDAENVPSPLPDDEILKIVVVHVSIQVVDLMRRNYEGVHSKQ